MPDPVFDRIPDLECSVYGPVGRYVRAITRQWLLVAPDSNPAMLEMFRDRDRLPARDLMPWAGEFAGKYLTAAVQTLKLTGDAKLRARIEAFVPELIACQASDGYLGPWPETFRMKNHVNLDSGDVLQTWDTWGHYHLMLGLLLWYDLSGDHSALDCASRIGDLLCRHYGPGSSARLVDTGSTEMNLAPAHSLCLLFRATGNTTYLELSQRLVDEEFGADDPEGKPLAGDWLNLALSDKKFFEMPKPRWESLHPIMALAELYYVTGRPHYRQAFEQIWWSIRDYDRHNNGGFSSGEQAQGDPFHPGAIETCCTIAWIALSVEMLRMTGLSVAADEIELSTLNSVIGMHSASGRWCTYDTPMDGTRKASAHEIVFQAREGSPELNCCSVNGARGFGMIADWALMSTVDGLALNFYGPAVLTAQLPAGNKVTLIETTDYPTDGGVHIEVISIDAELFTLRLRIPGWCAFARVSVNGEEVTAHVTGGYVPIRRQWRRGDVIQIAFDFSPHFWVGSGRLSGKVSIYRGPLLLTYDRQFNRFDPDQIEPIVVEALTDLQNKSSVDPVRPILLVEHAPKMGQAISLVDFGSAGEAGTPYRSWLPCTRDRVGLRQYFGAGFR